MKNLFHNLVVHPICGILWTGANVLQKAGQMTIAGKLNSVADQIHKKFGPDENNF